MKTNLQEKGAQQMIALGRKEVKSKSRKYRAFQRPDKAGYFYFIGKRGAIRFGKNASSSISVGKVK